MTRHLTKLLLAASALTVLAAAPAAYAAPAMETKLSSTQKIAKRAAEKAPNTVKLTQRSDRGDRSRNRGDRSRNRGDRSRNRGDRSRNRGDRSRNRGDRSRNRGYRSNRNFRNDRNRGYNVRHRNVRSYSRNNRRGFRSNYRPRNGISFSFGSPGYSAFRWAPAAHSFYRPSYGSYGYYQRRTVCQRVIVDGWHHGYRTPISVKQCSNPWNGSYIVQGSERLVHHHW